MNLYKVARVLVRGILHLIYRVRIEGKENIPTEGTYVVCANHKSLMDPPLLCCCLPFPVRFMAKEELFRNKLFGGLLRAVGAFPIKRGKSDIGALKSAIRMLENQEHVAIFPEGTRSKGDTMKRGKQGAALIAVKAGVNILPVGIEGDYKLFHRMTFRIGKVISLEELFEKKTTGEELQAITDERIMPSIGALAGVKPYEG